MWRKEKEKWLNEKDLNYDHNIIRLHRLFYTNPLKCLFHRLSKHFDFDFPIFEKRTTDLYDDKFCMISLYKYMIV